MILISLCGCEKDYTLGIYEPIEWEILNNDFGEANLDVENEIVKIVSETSGKIELRGVNSENLNINRIFIDGVEFETPDDINEINKIYGYYSSEEKRILDMNYNDEYISITGGGETNVMQIYVKDHPGVKKYIIWIGNGYCTTHGSIELAINH